MTGRPAAAALQGHPLAAAAGQDVVFVSLRARTSDDPNGIEVLRRGPGGLASVAVIRLRSGPAGLALAPDGRVLLAALDDGVAVLDSGRASAGDPSALLGIVPTGPGSGTVQVVVAANRYVLTADQAAGRVTVLDLPAMEAGEVGPAAVVTSIDVDLRPAGLSVSPDGRYVYVVSQVRRPDLSLGPTDSAYGLLTQLGVPRRAGTLSVIDTRRIELEPAASVVARVPAGCSPSRVAASPDGGTVWVTARQSNELLAFRTDQLLTGRPARPAARVPVMTAAQGLALARSGRVALVGGSGTAVGVVDTAAALAGRPAVRAAVTVGGLPGEITLAPDQRTAYVAATDASALAAVDVSGLPGA
jgi:sugar lactone lactonase YvrE